MSLQRLKQILVQDWRLWKEKSLARDFTVGAACMVSAALASAAIEILGSRLPGGVSPLQVVWTRYFTHLLCLVALFGFTRRTELITTHRFRLQAARALTMLGMPIFFMLAARSLPLERIWAINWPAYLLAAFLSAPLLYERATRGQWAVVLICLAGRVLVIGPTLQGFHAADLFALAMGACLGFYLALSRRLREEKILASLFYTAAGVLAPLSLGLPFYWSTPGVRSLLIMVGIGFLGLLFLLLLDYSLERASVTELTSFFLIQPVWLLAIYWAASGARPDTLRLGGSALIIIALSTALILGIRQRVVV